MTPASSPVGGAAQAHVEQLLPALHPQAHLTPHRTAERFPQAPGVQVAHGAAVDGHDAVPGAQPAAGRRTARWDLDDPQPVLLAVGEAGVYAPGRRQAADGAEAHGEGASDGRQPSGGGVAGSPPLDNEVRTEH